jgi:hypothetical protein
MADSTAGRIPNRRSVTAMFSATPPGNRVIRPGTSDPTCIAAGDRPMMSHRKEPMHRMSGVMPRSWHRKGGGATTLAQQR